jgi:hypothetical protein
MNAPSCWRKTKAPQMHPGFQKVHFPTGMNCPNTFIPSEAQPRCIPVNRILLGIGSFHRRRHGSIWVNVQDKKQAEKNILRIMKIV